MEPPTRSQTMMKLTTSHEPKGPFKPGVWALPCDTWGEYLEKEKARIERDGARIAEIRTYFGRAALWVNQIV